MFNLGAFHKCQHFHDCTNIHFWGVSENQHFFRTPLTFGPDFYYVHGDFCHSKMVDVYSFWGREGVSESVRIVHS